MKNLIILISLIFSQNTLSHGDHAKVIPHKMVKAFNNNGNSLKGLATPGNGANQYEVWESQISPGKSTPLHKHETEEVFVFLKGEAEVTVGKVITKIKAPATVIAPANTLHQIKNTGKKPTHQIVIMGAKSKIWNAKGKELVLPWRK